MHTPYAAGKSHIGTAELEGPIGQEIFARGHPAAGLVQCATLRDGRLGRSMLSGGLGPDALRPWVELALTQFVRLIRGFHGYASSQRVAE